MRILVGALCLAALGLLGAWEALRKPDPIPASTPARPPAPVVTDRIVLTGSSSTRPLVVAGAPTPVVSLLNVQRRMQYGDYVWNDRNVPTGPIWVHVDLKAQLLSVFRSGQEIGTAVILYGATEKETPTGVFPILAKMSVHRSSSYDAEMPYTLRLTNDGVSIHASDVRWGRATHGCIGVPLAFAQKLFSQVSRGDKVVIESGQQSA